LFFEQAQYEEEVARLEPSRDTLLTRDEAIAIEPSLARIKFIGALQHGKDRVGNCSQYVEELARVCQEKGVTFLFEHSASDLNIENDRITSVKVISSDGTQRDVACDYVVLCAGVESCAPLVSSGWDWLPIMPVRGYTITGTASSKPEDVPQEYVLLEQPLHVLATRFGPKMRFASHAEITMAIEPNAARLEDLQEVVRTFFPDAFVNDDIELWMGRRPMTSDSMPIVGVGHLPNLLLCTGHGSDGWRWSHGTARLTAALLAGEPLPLPLRYLSLSRFFWF
jgi:D-amino-acid dehydrogenase